MRGVKGSVQLSVKTICEIQYLMTGGGGGRWGHLLLSTKIQYMERADTTTLRFPHVYCTSLATQINGISLVSCRIVSSSPPPPS